jgi:hypothetical protein
MDLSETRQIGAVFDRYGSAVSIQPCPKCQRPAPRLLNGVSAEAVVNYYRCDGCGHVWILPKGDSDAAPVLVTN